MRWLDLVTSLRIIQTKPGESQFPKLESCQVGVAGMDGHGASSAAGTARGFPRSALSPADAGAACKTGAGKWFLVKHLKGCVYMFVGLQ